jgi:hypothetical protein
MVESLEESDMDYDDGAETIVLYTKGKKGKISEEIRQFLHYMEYTNQKNAVNEDLKDIQQMVDVVKRDGEVSLRYMKSFEHDQLVYASGVELGRQAERENTERERQKAEIERKKTIAALGKVKELEDEVKKLKMLVNGK